MPWKLSAVSSLVCACGWILAIAVSANAFIAPAKASATASCSAAVTNGAFGSVNLQAGGSATTTASLTFNCSGLAPGIPVTLCPNLDAGSGGFSGASRLLAATGGSTINFQIYQNSADTQTWGTAYLLTFGAAPTLTVTANASGSASGSATLYASLPSQTAATPGVYQSTFSGESFIWGLNIASCAGVTIGSVISPAPFSFTATIAPTCSISATNINFGSQGVLLSRVTAQGALSVVCTPTTPFTVGLSGGLSNGPPAARSMTNGTQSITYGLYLDAQFTQPWGLVGQSQGSVASSVGTGTNQILTVFGQTPAQNTPAPGVYTDTVVATLTY